MDGEMLDRFATAIGQLEASVRALDPCGLDGQQAARLVEHCVRVERIIASLKLRAARRVEQTQAYGRAGHRSAAAWLAATVGVPMAQAAGALITAEHLEALPETAAALACGLISEAEAGQVAFGASVDTGAEGDLLAAAQRDSFQELRNQATRRRAAALGERDRDERLHAGRSLRDWSDAEGATCVGLRYAPAEGARLLAAVDARAEEIFRDAATSGRHESLAAYRADALLSLVDDAASGTTAPGGRGVDTCVNVLVDYAALVRGNTKAGERCEIPGVGPVSVATARRLLSDSVVKLIITDGVDVYSVTHAGRTVPARLRDALAVRDTQCCKPGCGQQRRLETHHYNIDYAAVPVARLDNLARLCHFHHRQVTLGKARLSGGPGHWEWSDVPDPPPSRADAGDHRSAATRSAGNLRSTAARWRASDPIGVRA